MSIVRALRILASQRPTLPPRAVAAPARVQRRKHQGVPVTWIDADRAAASTIVHLHGGGHLYGESPNHWGLLEEVGRRAGAATAMVHFRLPPRYPFPAALDDVLGAIDAMGRESLLRPGRWALSGDSAGGGLALAAAQSLIHAGADAPALLLLESPWADLTPAARRPAGTEGAEDGQDDEHAADLRTAVRLYARGVPPEDPRISPLHGELGALPPVHLVTGAEDYLVEDSRRLHAAITDAGGTATYLEIPGAGHDPAIHGDGPAAQSGRRSQIEAAHACLRHPAAT
ncbi:alpha/beta hydrolase fold domain-containing protein [Brachybacterium sp. GCM10030268]|uniref:alpha/beta hydrolase fold domain-containing protein n=1 Tax=Brachybacterium sp. GCM10030268 TaxID=3273382 RepID=UPI0036207582